MSNIFFKFNLRKIAKIEKIKFKLIEIIVKIFQKSNLKIKKSSFTVSSILVSSISECGSAGKFSLFDIA